MQPPRDIQPNISSVNPPQQTQEKPVINGFTVTSGTSAEKVINGFKVTINFPEGSIDHKSFEDYLSKFDEKPLKQMVGLISRLNNLSSDPEKSRTYVIKDYGTDKVGIMKSSGDKSKDISDPVKYYSAKFAETNKDVNMETIEEKINLINTIRAVAQSQFKSISNPISDNLEVARHQRSSTMPSVSITRTKSGEARTGEETKKPSAESKIKLSKELGSASSGMVNGQTKNQEVLNKPMTQLEKREAMAKKMDAKDAAIVDKHKHLELFKLKPEENRVLLSRSGNVNAPKDVVKCGLSKEENAFAHEISKQEGANHFTSDQYCFSRDEVLPFLEFNQFEDKYRNVDFSYFSVFHGIYEGKSIEITHDNIAERIKYDNSKDIAIPVHLNGNHWGLVYIDHEKKTVEFYDSIAANKSYPNMEKNLNEIAKKFGNYQVKYGIQKEHRLQFNGHDCGPWTMYFLQNRLENKNVDFSLLEKAKVEPMITNYRNHIVKSRLIKEFKTLDSR